MHSQGAFMSSGLPHEVWVSTVYESCRTASPSHTHSLMASLASHGCMLYGPSCAHHCRSSLERERAWIEGRRAPIDVLITDMAGYHRHVGEAVGRGRRGRGAAGACPRRGAHVGAMTWTYCTYPPRPQPRAALVDGRVLCVHVRCAFSIESSPRAFRSNVPTLRREFLLIARNSRIYKASLGLDLFWTSASDKRRAPRRTKKSSPQPGPSS